MADYKPPTPKIQQQDLKGKVAVVTGATKGIGRAIALDLATRGCSVLGTYSSPQSAHLFDVLAHTVQNLYSVVDSGPHGSSASCPKVHGIVADITNLASTHQVLSTIERDFAAKKIDILVLNASYNTRPRLGQARDIDIESSLIGNLHWPIALMEKLVQSKIFNSESRVVAISSDRVRDPAPGSSLFNATKAGMEALVRSWATELPLTFPGMTVNAVSVGLTDTPGVRSLSGPAVEALKAERVAKVKIVQGGRMGYAEDVADVVGWLVSEKARWQTGSVVAANGGAEWIGGSS